MIKSNTFLLSLLFIISLLSPMVAMESIIPDNELYPYKSYDEHDFSLSKIKRTLQSDYIYETFTSNKLNPDSPLQYRLLTKKINGQYLSVHVTYADSGNSSFHVYEPFVAGGCNNVTKRRIKTSVTAKEHRCTTAGNGGFFNTTNGACIGNIVSDKKIIQSPGKMNSNFGVLADGRILTGYISKQMINESIPFSNLVTGVLWIVRKGKNFVQESSMIEDMSAQETGNEFITVQSARSAIGHDASGRILHVQVDGKSWERGVNLYDFANLLIENFNVINAINLDGGGSMTSVRDSTLTNVPSDNCVDNTMFNCERAVSTIICFTGRTRE